MDSVKEVAMDVSEPGKKRRRRRTRKALISDDTTVEKEAESIKKEEPLKVFKGFKALEAPRVTQTIVLTPAKPKVMLVPKEIKKVKPSPRKTFKARKLQVVIDNSAKTQTRRKKVVADIESMSDEKVRELAVSSKIYTKEAAAKLPLPLLKSLMKDYRMMKGLLV
jgi:hypothetical protein